MVSEYFINWPSRNMYRIPSDIYTVFQNDNPKFKKVRPLLRLHNRLLGE